MALFLWVYKLSYYCPVAESQAQCVWSEKGSEKVQQHLYQKPRRIPSDSGGLMVCEPHWETRTREKCDHFRWPNKHCWITGMGQEGDKMLCEISQYTMPSF